MSSFLRLTRNPKTKEFEPAFWVDGMYGGHRYGVVFLNGDTYPEAYSDWETKDTNVDASWDQYPKELSYVVKVSKDGRQQRTIREG